MSKNIRSFMFSDAGLEHLDVLTMRIGAKNQADTIRRALALLDYATREEHAGGQVIYREGDVEKRLLVPDPLPAEPNPKEVK